MEDRYFDVFNRKGAQPEQPPQNPDAAPETAADAEPQEKAADSAMAMPESVSDTDRGYEPGPAGTDGDYSYRGSDIPDSRTAVNPPEYEVSYNSSKREYRYSDSFSVNPPNSSAPAPAKRQKKSWVGAVVAMMLVLSCTLGGLCGYLAAQGVNFVRDDTSSGSGSVTGVPVDAIVDRHTAIIENPATNQANALTKAAEAAYDSVVIIDTYASEEYERVGQASGAGSGVIWTSEGYIVTCNHVVDGAAVVKITLTDGKSYVAEVIGTDARTDLAVLKINATDSTLYPAVQRDEENSPLILAESVLAIGNPLGVLGGTTTEGILSALERNIVVEGQSMTLLQISASVNPGNSGGGLFDVNGSLIGIVNAKSSGEGVEGLGFAIPISTVKKVANELITNGYVTGRPQLGIQVVSVTVANSSYIFAADAYPDLRNYATKSNGWGRETIVTGAYLIDESAVLYEEGSTRMQYGDRITYVGAIPISDASDIVSALNDYSAGETISVTVVRNQSQTFTVQVVLGQAGANS